jgi:hypothetical protein
MEMSSLTEADAEHQRMDEDYSLHDSQNRDEPDFANAEVFETILKQLEKKIGESTNKDHTKSNGRFKETISVWGLYALLLLTVILEMWNVVKQISSST